MIRRIAVRAHRVLDAGAFIAAVVMVTLIVGNLVGLVEAERILTAVYVGLAILAVDLVIWTFIVIRPAEYDEDDELCRNCGEPVNEHREDGYWCPPDFDTTWCPPGVVSELEIDREDTGMRCTGDGLMGAYTDPDTGELVEIHCPGCANCAAISQPAPNREENGS